MSDGGVGAAPAGDPDDPGNLGGMGLPTGFGTSQGGGTGVYGGAGEGGGPGTGGVMDTKVVPIGGAEIKGGETPKVVEAKKAISRSTRRRTLLGDEEGGLEPVPIYRRSILGS